MALFDFPRWKLTSPAAESGVVAPDERLSAGQTLVMGVQHAVAMFGATVLMPLLMGLDPNLSILMSGVGTLLFFVVTGGRVPSVPTAAPRDAAMPAASAEAGSMPEFLMARIASGMPI